MKYTMEIIWQDIIWCNIPFSLSFCHISHICSSSLSLTLCLSISASFTISLFYSSSQRLSLLFSNPMYLPLSYYLYVYLCLCLWNSTSLDYSILLFKKPSSGQDVQLKYLNPVRSSVVSTKLDHYVWREGSWGVRG